MPPESRLSAVSEVGSAAGREGSVNWCVTKPFNEVTAAGRVSIASGVGWTLRRLRLRLLKAESRRGRRIQAQREPQLEVVSSWSVVELEGGRPSEDEEVWSCSLCAAQPLVVPCVLVLCPPPAGRGGPIGGRRGSE